MLEIQGIKKKYGRKEVLKNINLKIEKGQCVGIIGPNGSGKSTLLSIIVGVLKPSSGKIVMQGDIGYVPQDNALMEELTVKYNLVFWCAAYGKKVKEVLAENTYTKALGIEEMLGQKVKRLSGGMKKRVNIAIALINNPTYIILDEPCNALDIIYKNEVVDYLLELKKEGKTIIYTSHSGDEVERLCDKVCILKDGYIVREETIEGLRKTFDTGLTFDEMVYRLLK
ncbi:MAG: ABC transporter ATP-binding protein [Cellulosilyticum sp.]|nr:ABC transporter ATP-binding protein [Cellulosilyticum sp.]